ncbi:MAG: nucleotidyltransferase family protein [Lachnospiraceae bacterium]|nr:nucleotidyltransferase family protein [Lachnospiraceae bacterium]
MNSTKKNATNPIVKSAGASSRNQNHMGLTPADRPGCVIMASGLGRRFGENKLLTLFHGEPLISHILEITASPVFSCRIVVTRHKEIAELCRQHQIDFLLHQMPGQNDTIRLGLQNLLCRTPSLPGCCFCTGDQPLLTQKSLEALALTFSSQPDRICRCAFENRPGNPVIFPASWFPELLQLPNDTGGGYLIRQHPDQVLSVPVQYGWELEDIDCPEDMIRLSAIRTPPCL